MTLLNPWALLLLPIITIPFWLKSSQLDFEDHYIAAFSIYCDCTGITSRSRPEN